MTGRYPFPALAVLLLAFAACAPQAAQDPAAAPALPRAESTYLDLHKAIAAYSRCRGIEYTEAQREALETRAQRLAGEPLGAGTMLSLIEEAREVVSARIAAEGCDAPAVARHLARFEAELAAAAGY
jgi:hypothetical protein